MFTRNSKEQAFELSCFEQLLLSFQGAGKFSTHDKCGTGPISPSFAKNHGGGRLPTSPICSYSARQCVGGAFIVGIFTSAALSKKAKDMQNPCTKPGGI